MKRLLLVIMLIFGINIMSSGQLVKSSSISVTKQVKEETPKVKEKKAIPVKTGFRQYVDYEILAMEFAPDYIYLDLTTQIQYTAGYRFNEHFFLGGGAGIFIGVPGFGDAYETFSRFDSPDEHRCKHDDRDDSDLTDMPLRMLSFPLFVNARAYMLKSNIQPYASLSIGALLSGNATAVHVEDKTEKYIDYNCSRFFVNPALGVSFRLRSIDIHAAISWRMSLNPVCFDQSLEHALANSIGFVVGVSF